MSILHGQKHTTLWQSACWFSKLSALLFCYQVNFIYIYISTTFIFPEQLISSIHIAVSKDAHIIFICWRQVGYDQSLHIFWTAWGISMKFPGNISLMIILKVTKKHGFPFSLENTFIKKVTGGDQIDFPDFLRLNK